MIDVVVDGPLDQKTGGYLYDRIMVDGLRARGRAVWVTSLDTASPLAAVAGNARVATLLRRAARHRHTVIIDELCHPRAALAAAALGRSADLVTLVHHLAASETGGVARSARLALERRLLFASRRVIATSETTRGVLAGAGVDPSRIAVVRPGRDRLGVRAAPPAREGGLRLLCIGALTRRKDPLTLLAAFAGASAPGARLTLVGPADRDARLAAEVLAAAGARGRAVHVTGELDDTALARELGRADVLVLPSRYEGYGIVLAEALSHGLAVIACRAGAVPEVVRDGREAILVSPGDAAALGAAIAALAGDAARLEAMQAAALERARELPTWAQAQEAFASAIA